MGFEMTVLRHRLVAGSRGRKCGSLAQWTSFGHKDSHG